MRRPADLSSILAALDPQAELAQRHLWLISLLDWIRGPRDSVEGTISRVQLLLDTLEAQPAQLAKVREFWSTLVSTVDVTTLLADFGFAARTALFSEITERMRYKLLPASPETIDASELFKLALPGDFDARWINALPEPLLNRLALVLFEEGNQGVSRWRRALLDAITYCAGQILSTGFAPELRLRMSESVRESQPFHALIRDVESLRVEVLHSLRTTDRLDAAVQRLRDRLDACRAAASTVYDHFEDNGISVGLVFRLRQLRERILRVRELLDCLLSDKPASEAAHLMAHLVRVGRERHSLRALIASNSSILAAKVAERSAETGEHYITRDRHEYRAMVKKAAGGGMVMAFTTLVKFALYALALSAFWSGFWAGMNYAISFVLVQLLHFTVATKQPAMTAPAMAAKLKRLSDDNGLSNFVDEVSHLVRSQVAAVLGNVLVVFPMVILFTLAIAWMTGKPAINEASAEHVFESLHILGPTLFFAAFTGVLLFASSIIAGWTENWFVLHRLDSAIRYNPRITRFLGQARAERWAIFMRENLSGLAANISLGFMLGLVPAFAGFFGLGLDVRHVTLSAGQIGAASATFGLDVIHQSQFWWAMASLPLIGALNVSVSFYLAFSLALRAQNVSGVKRSKIYAALRARLFSAPLSFFMPERQTKAESRAQQP